MNLKLHIIAVTAFIFLGMLVLVLTDSIHIGDPPPPLPTEAVQPLQEFFIVIDSATWGFNCAKFAEHIPPFKPTPENPDPPLSLRRDNVLRPISSLCNGTEYCEIPIIPELLGRDPIPSCTKEMRIEYRCNELERVRRKILYPKNQQVILDCRNPETVEDEDAHDHEHDHDHSSHAGGNPEELH